MEDCRPDIVISKDFTFEASHILPKHPGKCARLHGHSWDLTVSVIGKVDFETGFVCDYSILKSIVNTAIIENVDHTHLGAGYARTHQPHVDSIMRWEGFFGSEFYPSSENLVSAIANILQPIIKETTNARLYEVALKETCTSAARIRIRDVVRDF